MVCIVELSAILMEIRFLLLLSLDHLLVQHTCTVMVEINGTYVQLPFSTLTGPFSPRGPPDWESRRWWAYSFGIGEVWWICTEPPTIFSMFAHVRASSCLQWLCLSQQQTLHKTWFWPVLSRHIDVYGSAANWSSGKYLVLQFRLVIYIYIFFSSF